MLYDTTSIALSVCLIVRKTNINLVLSTEGYFYLQSYTRYIID